MADQSSQNSQKRPKVDQDKCISCGTCIALVPKVFAWGDNGKSQVVESIPQDVKEADIQNAIDSCPVSAISWD